MQSECADVFDGTSGAFAFTAPVFFDHRARVLFDRAFSASERMDAETSVLELIAHLRTHSTVCREARTRSTPSIRRARERIDADPSAMVTLEELAREVEISRFQLIRGFVRELGLTPHAYIVQRRIALARRLVRQGRSLADAALLAGFCDQSHMTRSFVRQFGVPPSRYCSGR